MKIVGNKKEVLELNTIDTFLAQSKILNHQIKEKQNVKVALTTTSHQPSPTF